MANPVFGSPFAARLLPQFEVDFDRLINEVNSKIQSSRRRRGQAPLVPDGVMLIGQESVAKIDSAPGIVLVPRGFRYEHAREVVDRAGSPADTSNSLPDFDPRPVFSQWLELEAHCWGDDDPSLKSQNYAFSSATELARQLVVALVDTQGGPHAVQITGAQFVQKVDWNRQGRMLVLDIEVETFVIRDAPYLLPVAGPGGNPPGVVGAVVVSAQSQDGTSTVQETTFSLP